MATIAQNALEKESDNVAFATFLKLANGDEIDKKVQQINAAITPQINCTACGNCCKTLMINVTDEEADKLSDHLNQTRLEFDEKYLEKGNSMMVVNTMPCHFLANNKCTVYDYRFAGCREFPALHLPHFTKRVFTTFMHYNRCPIIYNVVERLKVETGFEKNDNTDVTD